MPEKRLYLPLAVKSAGAGQFSAYASTFDGAPDTYGDVIAPGAFSASIAEHRAAGTMPALLWHHDTSAPIGKITSLFEDKKGLRIDGVLAIGSSLGDDAYALMKVDALSMSIGYSATRFSPMGKRGRRLEAIKLSEVSAVAMPANVNAKIISVKSHATDADHIRRVNAAIAANVLFHQIIAASREIDNSI